MYEKQPPLAAQHGQSDVDRRERSPLSWKRKIANELLQSGRDAVLEELGQTQLQSEETPQRATAAEKKVIEAK